MTDDFNFFPRYHHVLLDLGVSNHREAVIDLVSQEWCKDDQSEVDADPGGAGEVGGPEAEDAHDDQHGQGHQVWGHMVTGLPGQGELEGGRNSPLDIIKI